MPENPCRDCTQRCAECHSNCDAYKEWRVGFTAMNETIRRNRHQKNIGYLGEHYRRPRKK